ncbi:NmrA family NAD(P)-binding protein [Modestobacter excelsi]|uniref:NmrA family NAD(P)-binding protein n=1 Tax=Modestobacter excelsi TaxID=2213161 RepID=UPI00110CE705|nr:NAD(P)H-binding protein [Modestobacter excelsi]
MSTTLITGASGTVGRSVVAALGDTPLAVRAFVRSAPVDPLPGVDYRLGDFADPDSLDAALAGVDAVFLACANVAQQVDYETTVINRAQAAGVRRLVKLSAHGAGHRAPVSFWRAHAQIEDRLRASGLEHVILRPYFLMSNLLGAVHTAQAFGMVFAPAAEAATAMVDPRDVGAVAAAAMTEATLAGRTLTITGGEPVSFHAVAQALADRLGKPVAYQPVSDEQAAEQLQQAGLPAATAAEIVKVFAAIRAGAQCRTGDVVREVTGAEPRTLVDYLAHVLARRTSVAGLGVEV